MWKYRCLTGTAEKSRAKSLSSADASTGTHQTGPLCSPATFGAAVFLKKVPQQSASVVAATAKGGGDHPADCVL